MRNDKYRPRFLDKWKETLDRAKELGFFETKRRLFAEEVADPKELVQNDLDSRRYKAERDNVKNKYEHLLNLYEKLDKEYGDLLIIKEDVKPIKIYPNKTIKKVQAVPIILYSDWHVGEVVDPKTVNGMNKYNPEICEKRVKTCFENSMRLIEKEGQDVFIDKVVIWLGGDFVSGYIHEEFMESNSMSPVEEVTFSKRLLRGGLDMFANNSKIKEVIVCCNVGNHARTSQRMKIATSHKNSYESMLYYDLKDYYSGCDKMKFYIPEGNIGYVDVFGYVIRHFHGHEVVFRGGIGGITTPLVKKILKFDTQRPADYNIMGHYHTYYEATRTCLINGSTVGFNTYGQYIGATPEPPVQGFRLLDTKRGFTAKYPIFCE